MRYDEQRQLLANIPDEERSQASTRAKRKRDAEVQDEDDGGVALPETPTKQLKTSVLNAEVHSPQSLTAGRRSGKRFGLKEEVDDLQEETQREASFAKQTVSGLEPGI